MNKVYILEFKSDNPFAIFISWLTGKYVHTEIFTEDKFDKINFGLTDKNYHEVHWPNIKNYLKKNPRVDAFKLPIKPSDEQMEKLKGWWRKKIRLKESYGFLNLISFLWKGPYRIWCVQTGRPYRLKDIDKKLGCSIAVDMSVLETIDFDMFPNFPERATYPGLFAKKFWKYKLT